MAHYEFHVVDADGSRVHARSCRLSDLKAAWEHVFAMATACDAPGSHIRVLDENGEIVIDVGAARAAELLRMREQYVRIDPAL